MLKPWRVDGATTRDEDAWPRGGRQIVVHEGIVGERGTDRVERVPNGVDVDEHVEVVWPPDHDRPFTD